MRFKPDLAYLIIQYSCAGLNVNGIFPSYLIGMKPDAFLIIKTPTIISNEDLLSKGTSLIAVCHKFKIDPTFYM